MKQSLQLKLGQQLTMTPQLQQAIRLLQLSTLDLQHEIQEAIESNPMLEVEESQDNKASDNNADSVAQADQLFSANELPSSESNNDKPDNSSEEWQSDIPQDLPVDSKWEDIYSSSPSSLSSSVGAEAPDIDARNSQVETLSDHLHWQLNLTPMSDKDRLIAATLIDSLDGNGMLATAMEELLECFDPELDVELDEINAVRHRIQQFDPVGVASLDLADCLLVQLHQLPIGTQHKEHAQTVIQRHLNLLASKDYTQLMRRTRLKEDELRETIQLIQTLDPRPGESYSATPPEYIVPDVFVEKREGRWMVELNPDISPRLRINSVYESLIKRADNSSENTYLRNNLQEARWFLKSLQSRNETLLKVASKIVEHQQGFLEHGEEAMKPLVLHDIAKSVEMHESTISRVTTQKYMHTPRGIFELKYFFSSHVATSSGGECSSTAIRAIIKKLVNAENPRKPLSDNKITALLSEQGIKVARRTIAKYRESLSIPPSNERKRLV